MNCYVCKTVRTFNVEVRDEIWHTVEYVSGVGGLHSKSSTKLYFIVFKCAACKSFQRTFTVLRDYKEKYVQKVGQHPAWEISIDRETADALGSAEALFQKGLICESQGYGIASYSYYRRVVEEKIDALLDDIGKLLHGVERDEYEQALIQVKTEIIAAKKIELVKELLPTSLRPDDLNPLDILYDALSEGIHKLSDEECLELAGEIKLGMLYLFKETARERKESQAFTSGMRKILDRRKRRS